MRGTQELSVLSLQLFGKSKIISQNMVASKCSGPKEPKQPKVFTALRLTHFPVEPLGCAPSIYFQGKTPDATTPSPLHPFVDFCALPATGVTPCLSPQLPDSFLLLIPGTSSLGPPSVWTRVFKLSCMLESPEERYRFLVPGCHPQRF